MPLLVSTGGIFGAVGSIGLLEILPAVTAAFFHFGNISSISIEARETSDTFLLLVVCCGESSFMEMETTALPERLKGDASPAPVTGWCSTIIRME